MKKYNLQDLLGGVITLTEQPPIRFAGVQVPMIQRDYAQGRESEAAVRQRFLTALFGALTGDRPLTLDFVYGSVQKLDGQSYFVPLDGQQRLTTLFLLHWYIGNRELAGDARLELATRLRKFSYATRSTARDFCENLTGVDLPPAAKPGPAIRNLAWFYSSYAQDPTVQAMLCMLDAIHENYLECGDSDLFPGLDGLTFYVLPLDGFGLSDELYIKMNARGKQLTGFENFKADLLNWLRDEANPHRAEFDQLQLTSLTTQQLPFHMAFATKLDTSWTNLFWRLGYKGALLDAAYMGFWNRFLAARYLAAPDSVTKVADRMTGLDRGQETADYGGFDHYQPLFAQSDTIAAAERLLDSFVAHYPAIRRVIAETWGEQAADWHPLARPISQRQRILFLALMRYLDQPSFDEESLRRWLRVVWNISIDSEVRSAEVMVAVMRVIDKLAPGAHSIYDFLASATGAGIVQQEQRYFMQVQLQEERQKAALVLAEDVWEAALIAGEKHGLFRGNVGFLLLGTPSLPDFQHRLRLACLLFSAKGTQGAFAEDHLLLRAVVSFMLNWSRLNALNMEDNEENWRSMLRRSPMIRAAIGYLVNQETEEILGQCLLQMVSRSSAILVEESHLVQRVRLVHEQLYQGAGLQQWMQLVGATELRWKEGHIYAYRYHGRAYNRVMLDTYRNAVANGLIGQLGFETKQRCKTSECFWGDELTLQRKEANWTVTAAFDPYATLRIGVRQSEGLALEIDSSVSITEQNEYWLLLKEYSYADVANVAQALELVKTIKEELFDKQFFHARIVVRKAATIR